MRYLGSLAAVLIAGVALVGAGTAAHAQSYPPPVGACLFVPSDPNPDVNQTIQVLLIWTDTAGDPLPGHSSIATVLQQPGSGAAFSPSGFTTGPDGTATLQLTTGDSGGVLTLAATCGSTETQVQVPIGGPPLPPNTGTGGQAGEYASVALLATLGGMLAAGSVLAGVTVARRRSWRRS